MNQFKEFNNQNFIELRFSNKNSRELSQDEAMIRYKRNNYILGRIFSYDVDSDGQYENLSFDPSNLNGVTEGIYLINIKNSKNDLRYKNKEMEVEGVKQELENVKERHRESIEEFKKKQLQFKKYLEQQDIRSAHHFKDNEGMEKLIAELVEKQLLNIDHPFFKKHSPFYLSTDKLVKEVTLLEHRNAYREQLDEKQFAVFE